MAERAQMRPLHVEQVDVLRIGFFEGFKGVPLRWLSREEWDAKHGPREDTDD